MRGDISYSGSEIIFTESDFLRVSSFAEKRYGISIPPNKKDLIYSRISKRMRALNIVDFGGYLDRLFCSSAVNEGEHFLTLLTTNTTSFFRESHHFNCLINEVIPFFENTKVERKLRIWSAGCSFGHEPFSIAATLNEAGFGEACIVATDVDSAVLRRCREAKYGLDDITSLTKKETKMLGNVVSGELMISHSNRNIVNFENLNLISNYDHPQKFDVIFCRNVMIYFSKEVQQQVCSRFLDFLVPGGYLMLGHSERLTGPVADKFENVGLTTYRRFDKR